MSAVAQRYGHQPRSRIPPLSNGDRLSRAEFERRYKAMANVKKAELLEGIVYMPSPVSFLNHGGPHSKLNWLLQNYCMQTPGVLCGDNSTVRLGIVNEPQPDLIMVIEPDRGGRIVLGSDGFIEGSPELVVEIASSTVSYDAHVKKEVYRRNGVPEYVLWRVNDNELDWFALKNGDYELLSPDTNGSVRSLIFPGLWLNISALLAGDMKLVEESARKGLASAEHRDFIKRLKKKPAKE